MPPFLVALFSNLAVGVMSGPVLEAWARARARPPGAPAPIAGRKRDAAATAAAARSSDRTRLATLGY